MLLFCPTCSNMLVVSKLPPTHPTYSIDSDNSVERFECRTCPYEMVLDDEYYETVKGKPKEAADIIEGKDEWANLQKTKVQCPNDKCDGGEAYFYSMQTRSADEPMTNFMKCTKCGKQWRD